MNKKIALCGVPNCGKTTFWNRSTGKSEKTGNWSGVTLKEFSATLLAFPETDLIDLPGVYSLSGKAPEEIITANFLKSKSADSVIILIDGTKPEPGIYLLLEILSLGLPSSVGINFSDEMNKRNISVDIKKLQEILGVPVFLISSINNKNLNELIISAKNAASAKKLSSFSDEDRHKKAFEIVSECFFASEKTSAKSNPIILFLVFAVLIPFLSKASSVLTDMLADLFTNFAAVFSTLLNYLSVPKIISSAFSEGIIPGCAAVFSFLPELFLIFFVFSFLEYSGYMARAAFFSDCVLKSVGLSGKSVIPVLIGFGCTVPAVISAQGIENKEERSRLLSFLMFIPCSARLPLAFLITEIVFPSFGKSFVLLFYLATISLGFLLLFFKKRFLNPDFILELPEIRVPPLKRMLKSAFSRTKIFFKKSSFAIVLTSVLIWFLKNYSFDLKQISLPDESILYYLSGFISTFFLPTGIPFEGIAALFCGLFSKESALSALVAFSSDITEIFDPISGFSFLLFYYLYSPCSAAISAVYNEFGFKKAAWLFLRQTALAYFVSFSFFQLATFFKNIFIL